MSTMPSAPTQPAQEPEPAVNAEPPPCQHKGRVKLADKQLAEHKKQFQVSIILKQKLNIFDDETNPPQPLKEMVSYLNKVTALTASFVFCGRRADEETADPESQEKHEHQADHLWDLIGQCNEENLKQALYAFNIALDVLIAYGVESTALTNLKTVITDGMNDFTVRNIAEIYEAMSPLMSRPENQHMAWEHDFDHRLIPNDKTVNNINYVEVADSGRKIGNIQPKSKETHADRRRRTMK